MQNILLVTETKNFLAMSIKTRLNHLHYEVHEIPANTDIINKLKENIMCILIYADEKLGGTKQQQALNFIKDRAVTDDIPIFAIGNPEETEIIKGMIPKHLIHQEFARPVNVMEMTEELDEFIKQHSLQVKKKILLVDDSGTTLRNIKGWLDHKYMVTMANSGAMAIKYLSLNRPDLILLDYEMPVVDGKQVLEMIRTEADFCDIPVIFLTAKSDKESIAKVSELKPDGYLLKSMEPSVIIGQIDEFFEKRKGFM